MQFLSPVLPVSTEIVACGAGIIGLSLALELRARGAEVVVLEQATTRVEGQASWAAAGMLAVEDPHNPEELREFSRWSRGLYDGYLERIAASSGQRVSFQTHRTQQFHAGGVMTLEEQSLDPRELMTALELAVERAGVCVVRGFHAARAQESSTSVRVADDAGRVVQAQKLVRAEGAWFAGEPAVKPSKGQMLRVRLELEDVHRSAGMYVVPRHHGPQAGTALVGATVEDAGFDAVVDAATIERQLRLAAELVPAVREAEVVETWSGFRPATASGLPAIGGLAGTQRQFVAAGHFRNGILLAPGTAHALADVLEGKPTPEVIERFLPR